MFTSNLFYTILNYVDIDSFVSVSFQLPLSRLNRDLFEGGLSCLNSCFLSLTFYITGALCLSINEMSSI